MDRDAQRTQSASTLIEKLFTAGAHFGFAKSRRHPSVAPYLYGVKQGTDIIDLTKTSALIEDAVRAVEEAGAQGKSVLFVGTKEEVQGVVRDAATRIEMPYVVNRWIGGMLTNWSEIRKRLARLQDLEAQGISGELERKYTKKERVIIGREIEKLTFNFGGIRTMDRHPGLLVIVDPRHDGIALREALDMNIPTVGIVSSDTNIARITYPIVMNDALQASVRTVLEELTNAYTRGVAKKSTGGTGAQ